MSRPVAVFRTGDRGARLVPRKSKGLKIHSTYTVVQTDGELATFGKGRESQNLLELNCSAMPTAKLRHWVGRGSQNLFYAHQRAKTTANLRHWVKGGGGAQVSFAPVTSYSHNPPLVTTVTQLHEI
ncbi:hypothetical protein AVEN_71760-1 [Araneus ventricosus]|uniref:Uncharacterized protein n=1 Tax=Araneus ventricosus TaxID=182803 RepID=A0A4Y2TI94_ARAVE|nr:hypothetical protein AVEN_145750-1 [Araneus ventricosus]GBO00363.1 hypothetical protein AVEN_71760-1 [Araneus ventricosus]